MSSQPDAAAPRDLVLAAVENYDWEKLRPFVESLRATGFAGDVRFFVANVDEETRARLRAANVELSPRARLRVPVRGRRVGVYTVRLRWPGQTQLHRLVRGLARLTPDPRRTTARIQGALANVDVARYFWYWDYLSRAAAQYRNVMLTDVRDVVFLGQPFDFEIGDDACFFLEDEGMRLGTQQLNREWLESVYGPGALETLGDRPISCAGVTIGAAPAVLEYLTLMVDRLARLPRQGFGFDQAIHNYVIHTGRVPNARIVRNDEGPVLTLGIMRGEDAEALVRARARDAKVIHQYDRHPHLAETVKALLPAVGVRG